MSVLARLVFVSAVSGYALSFAPAEAQQRPADVLRSAPSPQRTFLDQYCVRCHNQRLRTAGLTLDSVDLSEVGADAEVWEHVVRKLRAGTMPPPEVPQPENATRDGFVTWLEAGLDRAAAAAPNPGRTSIHRLNRLEYTNAIRDLLALEIDGKALLPADESAHGFDNMADVLTVSPGLLERYVLVAKKVSGLAFGDPSSLTGTTYTIPMVLSQEDRMSEDLPFGTRGGVSIRHYFPLDGDYLVKVRLHRVAAGTGGDIRGLDRDDQVDFWLDGARVKSFTFTDDKFERGCFTLSCGSTLIAGTVEDDERDAGLQVRIPVSAGPHVIGVTFAPERNWHVEGVGPARLPLSSYTYHSATQTSVASGRVDSGVESVEIGIPSNATVPQDSPSRRRIFVCRPASRLEEEPCARTILSALARRAYRRPVVDADVQTLLHFYHAGRRDGSFETGIRRALERILVGPEFLFRVERTPTTATPGAVYRISDIELASQLSFFLWSSLPDDRLLDLAARGELQDAVVLEQEVRRMLADPRSAAFISSFFGQWLHWRNLEGAAPDVTAFPEFDENLRAAFERETQLFLESQLHEDRSALDLLRADYTFVNERLAQHYGTPHVKGRHFRRVTFSTDQRAGLLGHGSILTTTSYAHRTSPVVRGKWVLENLLGTPPPVPPVNVPPFPEDDGTSQPTSVRERMEQHRANPVCAACHAQLDPLGFAFENFDGIGGWRATEAGTPIDASGALTDGTIFDGSVELGQVLLQGGVFVSTLTEKLLTYALGRGVQYYDMPVVRTIVRDAASTDYRWSSLILGIVNSAPFQMRRAES